MSDDWRTNKHAVSSTIAKASSPAGPFLMRTEGDPITADSRWTRLASSRGTPEQTISNCGATVLAPMFRMDRCRLAESMSMGVHPSEGTSAGISSRWRRPATGIPSYAKLFRPNPRASYAKDRGTVSTEFLCRLSGGRGREMPFATGLFRLDCYLKGSAVESRAERGILPAQ